MMIRIGTSGYVYPEWRGTFYPKGLRTTDRFGHYAGRFDTVELNAPFYRFPTAAVIQAWRRQAPPGFLYAVKAWKGITHNRKIANCERELREFMERAAELGDRLGPVLFQLPPRFHADLDRLRAFVRLLPRGHRCAMEFRDPTWMASGVYDILRDGNVAACRTSTPELDGPANLFTADFGYWRLHGRKAWYTGRYTAAELAGFADEIRASGRDAYVYFDNTADVAAVADADALRAILGPR
jgi:uncharacterized protein YecE (DUF72 family)